MSKIPFSSVVDVLEAAGYSMHHRTKYPGRDDAYFYFFVDREGEQSGIGFPVRAKMVQQRYYGLILDTLKRSNDENDKDEDG